MGRRNLRHLAKTVSFAPEEGETLDTRPLVLRFPEMAEEIRELLTRYFRICKGE